MTLHKVQHKQNLIVILFLSLLCLSLNSCENEDNKNELTITDYSSKINLEDERLVFDSKYSFVKIYENHINSTDEELNKLIMPFYEKGFYSLRPLITEQNEEYIYNHYKELLNKDSNEYEQYLKILDDDFDDFDQIEEVIGDDTFSVFLNSNGEIQIDKEIYKYTDVGLFICKVENYEELNKYLLSKNISQKLTEETLPYVKNQISTEFPLSGLTIVNNEISYYRITAEETGIDNTTLVNKSTNQKIKITSKIEESIDPNYLAFLSNLEECDEESGLFANLFGDNNVCIDRYENRRRVKTKAFNYDYFLVYHLGVKCVHQNIVGGQVFGE